MTNVSGIVERAGFELINPGQLSLTQKFMFTIHFRGVVNDAVILRVALMFDMLNPEHKERIPSYAAQAEYYARGEARIRAQAEKAFGRNAEGIVGKTVDFIAARPNLSSDGRIYLEAGITPSVDFIVRGQESAKQGIESGTYIGGPSVPAATSTVSGASRPGQSKLPETGRADVAGATAEPKPTVPSSPQGTVAQPPPSSPASSLPSPASSPASSVSGAPSATGMAGCWNYNGASIRTAPDGQITGYVVPGRWREDGNGRYTITWAPLVDTVNIGPDGRSLSGVNNYGPQITATRLPPTPAGQQSLAGMWQWSNGATVAILPAGRAQAGTLSGKWTFTGGPSYKIEWNLTVSDQLSMAPDAQRMSGKNNLGAAVSAIRTMCPY